MPAQDNIKITRQGSNTAVYIALVKKKNPGALLCVCNVDGVPQFYCFCRAFGICRMFIVKVWRVVCWGQGVSKYSAGGEEISCT